jgi:paraquat-inducible protein B
MNSRSAVVGAFILGAVALGVGAILFFGGRHLFETKSRAVVFFEESIAGLDVGSPVTFHGVRVGSVQSISIRFSPETMTARIPVYLEIEPGRVILEGRELGSFSGNHERLIRAGLRAQLALQSFVTGQLRVDLDFRPEVPAQLVGMIKDVPEIPAVPSEISQLRNQLSQLPLRELAETARQTLASMGRLSDHLDAALGPLATSALGTTEAATRTLQTTNDAVHRLQADASATLHHLDDLLTAADHQLDARGGELSRTLTAADRSVHQAETLLDSLNGLADPRSQFRGDLAATVRDLAASASSLRNFAETVERNPNALLVGRATR